MYLQLLNTYFLPMLQEVLNHMIFKEHRDSPYYTHAVGDLLGAEVSNSSIGRGDPTNLPAYTPNLTPCTFSLQGSV